MKFIGQILKGKGRHNNGLQPTSLRSAAEPNRWAFS